MNGSKKQEQAVVSRREWLAGSAGAITAGTLARWAAAGGAGAVAASFLATQASAQQAGNSKLYDVINRKVLIIGTGTGNPPWHFQDEKGEFAGFDIAMGRLVAKALFDDPTKVQFQVQSADSRIPSILTGKVDAVFQYMTVTGQRAQQVDFSIPYYREGVGLLMLKSSKYDNYKALLAAGDKVKVSVLQTVYADNLVHAALPKAQAVQLDSVANTLLAVDSQRADCSVTDQSTIRWLILKFPGKYKDSGKAYFPNLYAAALKPGDVIWRTFVNTALADGMSGTQWDYYKQEFKTNFGVTLPDPPLGFPDEARMDQALGLIKS